MLLPETAPSSSVKLDAEDAVCLVSLDPQELQERTADPVAQECPVPLDSQESPHLCVRSPHHRHAVPAHPVQLDQLDLPEPPEIPDAPAHLAAMETTALPVPPDPRDLPAPEANQDPTVNLEIQDLQLLLNPSSPETQDHPEIPAHKVFPETQELQAPTANPETPDPKDLPDHLDRLDHPDPTDSLDLVDLPAHKENVVCARNIALWTVEYFSKTEPEDKLSKDFLRSGFDDPSRWLLLGSNLLFIIS